MGYLLPYIFKKTFHNKQVFNRRKFAQCDRPGLVFNANVKGQVQERPSAATGRNLPEITFGCVRISAESLFWFFGFLEEGRA
jgi:hypothetical protein